MIVDRYYYQQLNKQEQAIYQAFYDGVMAHRDIIPIPVKGAVPQAVFDKVYAAITRDNPLIYYLNQSSCSVAQDLSGHIAICPQYFFSKEKVKEYNRKIEKVVNGLVGQLQLLSCSDYEKELRIHDWICQNVAYDFEGSDNNKPTRVIVSHNIIGVFAHRRAQCEGIAKAVKVLLNTVDVKCIVVTGEALEKGSAGPHAWNIVNLDGKAYHLDVTWDMGAVDSAFQRVPYDYFNVSDQMILQDHKADAKLPECLSLLHNYFTMNKLNFQSENQMLCCIEKELKAGKTEFYFRMEGKRKVSVIVEEIYRMTIRILSEKGITGKRVKRIANDEMGTCWIKIH